jgi:hypothetical protein
VNPRIVLGSQECPKASRDFLFDLARSEIPFRLIVGKRDLRMDRKGEHAGFIGDQPFEEIPSGGAPGFPFALSSHGERFFLVSLTTDLVVDRVPARGKMDDVLPIGRVSIETQEEAMHTGSPPAPLLP